MSKRMNGEGNYRQVIRRRTEKTTGKVVERKMWECRLTLPDGQRKSVYGKSLNEVKQKQKDALRQIAAGIDIGRKPDTVSTFLHRWLEDVVEPSSRPRTTDSYRSMVRLHIEPAIGKHKLRDLNQTHIDAMMRGMTEKGLSPRTVAYARAIIRAALTYAQRAQLVERNAAQFAKPPAQTRTERPYLTAEQSALLLDTARTADPELLPMLTVALYTGLRIGELAGLGWNDIDLATRRLRVRRTVYWVKGEYGFGEPKTARSARTLTLPRPAVAALQAQSDRQAFLKKQAGHRWRDYDLVFSSVLGTPIDNSNVDRRLRVLLKTAGLPKMGFHGLRHSCASLLVSQGIPLRVVMEQLGHSQMSLTSDLYSHVAPAMLDDAADAIEKALSAT